MKIWVFVEGESDRIALDALWARWRDDLGRAGWGIKVIPLDNKANYLKKIGHRAAEKMVNNERDLAVGLPDLYPAAEFQALPIKHACVDELKSVQSDLVKKALVNVFHLNETQVTCISSRFYPTAFSHDAEMLLLAAKEELRAVLRTSDTLGSWRHPVESQNQERPPKRIVEELFYWKTHRKYRDTVHMKSVLDKVKDVRNLLYGGGSQIECPVFKEMLDWISARTGVAGY